MSNDRYGGINLTTAGNGLAYAAEQVIQTRKVEQYMGTFPLLSRLMKRMGSESQLGPLHIFPIWLTNGAGTVVGVARPDEATTSIVPGAGDGTFGQLTTTTYANAELLRVTEARIFAKGDRRTQIRMVEQRVKEVMEAFRLKITTDLYTSQDASGTKIAGLPYILASGNTVHAIPQGANPNWQAKVMTGVGSFDLGRANQMVDELVFERESKFDLMCLATQTHDLWQKLRDMLGSNIVIHEKPKSDGVLEVGYEAFKFRGAECVRDHRMPAGEIYYLDSETFFWEGDKTPKADFDGNQFHRVDNTLSKNKQRVLQCAFGCTSIRPNGRMTGVTS